MSAAPGVCLADVLSVLDAWNLDADALSVSGGNAGAAPDVAHSTQQLVPLFATTATPKCHRGLPFTAKASLHAWRVQLPVEVAGS
jgi:hypothetical protein